MFDRKDPGHGPQVPGSGAANAAGPGKQTRVQQLGAPKAGAKPGAKPGHAKGNDKPDDNSVMTDGQIHIITEGGLHHLRLANPAAAKTLFDNKDAYIVLKPGQHMPEGWKGKATALFTSVGDFKAAAPDLKAPIQAVVYDNEHWAQTDDSDKQNPSEAAKEFLETARQHNLTFIAAPTRKYLAADAKYADIIDVQLQDRESHTGGYLKAMRHDIKLAHHEHDAAYKKAEHSDPHLADEMNPDIKVVGQITSNVKHLDPGQRTTLGKAEQHAENDIVEGENPKGKGVPGLDGFWGYLYQGSHPGPKRKHSVAAGDHILADLAKKEQNGRKV